MVFLLPFLGNGDNVIKEIWDEGMNKINSISKDRNLSDYQKRNDYNNYFSYVYSLTEKLMYLEHKVI